MPANNQDPDLERKLENWARWRLGDFRQGAISPFPAYNLGPRPPRAAPDVPLLGGEAMDIEEIVNKHLQPRHQHVIVINYLWAWLTQEKKAQRCGVSINTFKARLVDARLKVKCELFILHEKYESMRPKNIVAN